MSYEPFSARLLSELLRVWVVTFPDGFYRCYFNFYNVFSVMIVVAD